AHVCMRVENERAHPHRDHRHEGEETRQRDERDRADHTRARRAAQYRHDAQDRSEVARTRGSSTTTSTGCPSIAPQRDRRTVTPWDSRSTSKTRRRPRCSTPTPTSKKVRSRRSSTATAAED